LPYLLASCCQKLLAPALAVCLAFAGLDASAVPLWIAAFVFPRASASVACLLLVPPAALILLCFLAALAFLAPVACCSSTPMTL